MRTPTKAALATQFASANPSRLTPVVPEGFGPAFPGVLATGMRGDAPASIETGVQHGSARAADPAFDYELAVTSAAMGFHEAAIDSLRELTARTPDHALAWRKLADLLPLAGNDAEAAAARAAALRLGDGGSRWKAAKGERSPLVLKKADRRLQSRMQAAPQQDPMAVLRDILFNDPLDVAAMRQLALEEWRADDTVTARALLQRALSLSACYTAAREVFADLLVEMRAYALALAESTKLLAESPRNARYLNLRVQVLAHLGRFAEAIEILQGLIKQTPGKSHYWLTYGDMLHFVGRREDSVKAYRTCLQLSPQTCQAYWGLADLKGHYLTPEDVSTIQGYLDGHELDAENRTRMCYAVAQYHERAKDFPASFAAYAEGARAFREAVAATSHAYDPDMHAARLQRIKSVFSAPNLAACRARAVPAAKLDTPIFVIGMPRAGSTLVEQILASHSLVEGTRELTVVGDITRELMHSRALVTQLAYPDCVLDLSGETLAQLGERYVREAGAFRKTDRPYFIDKRPWNWMEAGLIDLILPHAKLIDIRRAPMAACFAMFKQMLPTDAAFSYDLNALGRYYNEYVNIMDHYEHVMPGRILHVQYERLVEDTETEIRRMLDYCGLPFEDQCLHFWKTERAVATPSAEQVRRPIFRDALEQWRNFEPWLDPLKESLGRTVDI